MAPLVSTIEIACPPRGGLRLRHRPAAIRRVAARRGEREHARRLKVHHDAADQRRRTHDDPTDHPQRSASQLGRARHRRPHPPTRRDHRRADRWRHRVTSDVRARLRGPRTRRPPLTAGAPAGAERRTDQLPQPQEAPRKRPATVIVRRAQRSSRSQPARFGPATVRHRAVDGSAFRISAVGRRPDRRGRRPRGLRPPRR